MINEVDADRTAAIDLPGFMFFNGQESVEGLQVVDFSYTPEPHIAFCPIFVHPFFEEYALNPFLHFYLIFVQPSIFSAVLSIFREGVIIEHHISFRVVFCPAEPKINP